MARFGFCNGFYALQSANADAQLSKNLYTEIEGPDSKSGKYLLDVPGLAVHAALADAQKVNGLAGRGSFAFRGRVFTVSGQTLYEIFSDGEFKALGTGIGHDGSACGLAANVNQLAIVSAGQLFILTLASNNFQGPIAVPNSPLIDIGLYGDGYFIAASQTEIQISALLDGTTWPGLQVQSPSIFPDLIVGIAADHRELFVAGVNTSQGYYNSGSLNIFDPIPGGTIELGLAAARGWAQLDNTIFFWGAKENKDGGGPIAYRAAGYQPQRISHHGIENYVQNFPAYSDMISWAYQDKGHTFFMTYFPSANSGRGELLGYDVSTGDWHQRVFNDPVTGLEYAYPAMSHCFAWGKHLVQDPRTGTIYQMSSGLYDHFGNPRHWTRRAPHLGKERQWVYYSEITFDMETGFPVDLRSAPTVIIIPDDQGQNWQLYLNDDFSGPVWNLSASGLPQNLVLNDATIVNTSYSITITHINGQPFLTATPIAFQANAPFGVVMGNQAGTNQAILSISGGQFQTSQAVAAQTQRDVQVILKQSNDSGHTWSDGRIGNAGQTGEYGKRVVFRRLGRAGRNGSRVFELSGSDPVPVRIVDAYLESSIDQPQERLNSLLRKGA